MHLPLALTRRRLRYKSKRGGVRTFPLLLKETHRENNFIGFWTSVQVHGAQDWDVGKVVSPCTDETCFDELQHDTMDFFA